MLQAFKQFHALIERKTDEKLKYAITGNGGEYCGPFDEYSLQEKWFTTTIIYCREQNP